MKTWLGLLLTVGTLMVGCASGDYARRPAYGERPPASGIRGCGIKIRRPTPSRKIGYGVKNPAADRMVGDDLPKNREK